MDPACLKEEFGDRICFHGTISTQKILPFGTPADVADEVRRRIATVGKNGGFILTGGASIDKGNMENLRAMMDAAKEYGVY